VSEYSKIIIKEKIACAIEYNNEENYLLIFGGCGYDEDSSQLIKIDLNKIKVK